MISSSSKSLEWFFKAPSAANFPQAVQSPALSSLLAEFSRLIDAYFSALQSVPDGQKELWLASGRDAVSLNEKLRAEFTAETGVSLVQTLEDLGRRLKGLSQVAGSADVVRVSSLFKAVLVGLVVYAKESSDSTFKQSVLDLIRRFEAS